MKGAEKLARHAARLRVRELRGELARMRGERKQRVKELRGAAKLGVVRARASMRALRLALKEAQRAARDVARYVAPGARARAGAELAAGKKQLAAARAATESELASARSRSPAHAAELVRRLERKHELDDFARTDIPAELHPVWERVKHQIHATKRMSRAEAFMHWVHENSADVERMVNEEMDRELAARELEERELGRALKQRRVLPAALKHAVPF